MLLRAAAALVGQERVINANYWYLLLAIGSLLSVMVTLTATANTMLAPITIGDVGNYVLF